MVKPTSSSDASSEQRTEFISCSAVAHSSTANLGPGFDVFGLGLDAFEDTVTITRGKKIEDSVPHVNLHCQVMILRQFLRTQARILLG